MDGGNDERIQGWLMEKAKKHVTNVRYKQRENIYKCYSIQI